jgi:transposase
MLSPATSLLHLGRYTEHEARIPNDDKDKVAILRREINKEAHMISFGVDISKMSFDVAIDGNGTGCKVKHFSYNVDGIASFTRQVQGCNEQTLVTMEATGRYHLRLAEALHASGITVSVVNPLVIKRYGEMKLLRMKSDKADAILIAEYGRHEKAALFKPVSHNQRKIMEILHGIDDFTLMRTQILGRLEALRIMPEPCTEVIDCFQETLIKFAEIEKQLEKQLRILVEETDKQSYDLACSIPGIGKRVGSLVVGMFGNFATFTEAGQAASFIGLTPFNKRSGTSVNLKGSISKKGSPYARKLFYLASLSAAIHNPHCRVLYQRLIGKGKCKREAHVAVAHKLLRQVFGVVKNNRPYDHAYEGSRKCA